jgi:hypothetical protein
MIPEEEAGFLARWSRRKRAAQPDPAPEDPAPEDPARVQPKVAAPVPAPDPQSCPIPGVPEIDLSLLPRIEDLRPDSDFSLFLRPGIPAALRGAALRRMWSLDPAIRDFIGPADYAWDYNDPAGMPPGFSLQIGEGVRKLLAQAIGEPDEDAPKAAPPAPDPAGEPVEEAGEAMMAEGPPQVEAELPGGSEDEKQLPRRRHGGAMPA